MTDELAMTLNEAKAQLALWIEQERAEYAGPKWEEDNRTLQEEIVQTGQWANHVFSYVKRAEGMTLATPQGRQQLGKVITSATSLLEHAMMIYGDMPQPGVSSTDGALPWVREPEPDVEGTASPKDLHFPALIEMEGPPGKKFLQDVPPKPGLPGKHGETRTGFQPGTYAAVCKSPTHDPSLCPMAECQARGTCTSLLD